MPLADVNGAQVFYTDTGAPSGNPDAATVVFGHGLLFSGWMFADQVEALKDEYRCVTIDWRSQGQSPAARDGHDMDTLTLDLTGLLDELGLDRVHYVGLSMGGFVGMRVAARYPDRLLSLTLINTSAGPEPRAALRKNRLLAVVYRLVGIGPVRKPVEQTMFSPVSLRDPAFRARVDEWTSWVKEVDRAGMKRALHGVFDRPGIADEIGNIRARTLVVAGSDDVPTPVDRAREVAAGISGARLEIVPDCGHSSTIEQPAVLTKLIREHIAG
jgi:pimeloyl-ACP methyl ester carboxylesterase